MRVTVFLLRRRGSFIVLNRARGNVLTSLLNLWKSIEATVNLKTGSGTITYPEQLIHEIV